MKLRRPQSEERFRRPKAVDVLGQEQAPIPIFSAREALESHAPLLKTDAKVTNWPTYRLAGLQAKLAVLIPTRAATILDQSRTVFPKNTQEVTGKGSNLFLFAQQFPETQAVIRQAYSIESLRQAFALSLGVVVRPQVWPLVLGRILYPNEDWSIEAESEKSVMDKIHRGGATAADTQTLEAAAHLVLIDPKMKASVQTATRGYLPKFEAALQRIFANTEEIINAAFELEIIFGDTIQGLDKRGQLLMKQNGLSSGAALPDRLIA